MSKFDSYFQSLIEAVPPGQPGAATNVAQAQSAAAQQPATNTPAAVNQQQAKAFDPNNNFVQQLTKLTNPAAIAQILNAAGINPAQIKQVPGTTAKPAQGTAANTTPAV
jgi:hypothetical protein